MKDKYKIFWWIFLLISLSIHIFQKNSIYNSSEIIPFHHLLIFILWIILLILPFFKEINIFGFSLKKDIEKIKNDISSLLSIHQSINSSNNTNFQLTIPQNYFYPSEIYLNNIKEKFFNTTIRKKGKTMEEILENVKIDKEDETYFKFYNSIIKELKRIFQENLDNEIIVNNYEEMLNYLVNKNIITTELRDLILYFLKITNIKLSGGEITVNQDKFIKEIFPSLQLVLETT